MSFMVSRSLMIQLSLAVVLITSSVLTGFGLYRYQKNLQKLPDLLEQRLELKAKRLSISLRTPIFNYAEYETRDIILSEMEDPNIVALVVSLNDGHSSRYIYTRSASNQPVQVKNFTPQKEERQITRKILYETNELGEVTICMTPKFFRYQLQQNFVSDLFQIGVLDVILISLVILFLRLRFVLPVKQLTAVSSEISKGRLDQNIDVKSRDEIGVLAHSFIIMRDAIKKQIVDLNNEIDERIKAEGELKHLRNYLKNIVDSMPSILVGVDAHGKITQWNMEAEKITGVASRDANGKNLHDVFPQLSYAMEKVIQSVHNRQIRKDSKVPLQLGRNKRLSDITIYPLVTNGVEGAVIRVDDITERVRIEEMIVQSEKMLSVGGLAAGMAHEINNPLAGILQNVQVMGNRMKIGLPKNQQVAEECGTTMASIEQYAEKRGLLSMVAMIMEAGQRAAKIVENMLSFSRKGQGNFEQKQLTELIERTIELAGSDYDLKKKYDFRQIHIVREYEKSLPEIYCEQTKIQQVFLNLFKNAAQAMVNDKNDSGKPCLIIRARRQEGMVCVEVEDNGVGMDEETRKRIFEPFFTTKEVGAGTGLGLSISYFIVTEDHGGEMSVESFPGEGTTFRICLPIRNDH
ncbi:MAG: PAS domain S-box protein [Desulfobacteraceae bacterium]|nr:MAG: PAS domain S-box protein [Desulfobacteraceae bacterium]